MSEAREHDDSSAADQALVSVVIAFLDEERFLSEAIESVLGQTHPSWELLLVDDGSTDGSTRIARDYAARFPQQIRYLEHPGHENCGASAARNVGLRHAIGSYIALLDADDRWLPTKLARQVAELERLPDVDMIYGETLYWHSWQGEGNDWVQRHRVGGNRVWNPPELVTHFLNGIAAVPCTCSLMIRKAAAEAVGGFEESFPNLYDDQVFYAKVCLERRVFVSNECLDWYRQHPDSTCARLAGSESEHNSRRAFLSWLAAYVEQRGLQAGELRRALRREIWRSQPTSLAPLPSTAVRLARKWILRFESILPEPLRRRIWNETTRAPADRASKPSS